MFVFFSPGKRTVCTWAAILCSKRIATKIRVQRNFHTHPTPSAFCRRARCCCPASSQPGKTSSAPASFVIPSHGFDCSMAACHCWGKQGYHAPAATTTHSGSLHRPSKKTKNKEQFPQNPHVLFKGTRVSSEHAFWTLSWTCVWEWW